ncbi:MAG: hypothetical protein AB7T48_14530 [Solirubrobacterales bacterium]
MVARNFASALVASALIAVIGVSTALAAGPPIVNLSPVVGTTFEVSAPNQAIQVAFSCPSFETSYKSKITWTNYSVVVATSPELNPKGELATPFRVDLRGARPTNALEDQCVADISTIGIYGRPGTYYWQVHRINCDAPECREFGPVWSFNTANPPPPPPPGGGGQGGGARVTVYTACGLGAGARPSNFCGVNRPAGAFFRSSKDVRYKVCVKFPDRRSQLCARNQFAAAGTLYVNRITGAIKGRYRVSWTVQGRTYTRFLRKL